MMLRTAGASMFGFDRQAGADNGGKKDRRGKTRMASGE